MTRNNANIRRESCHLSIKRSFKSNDPSALSQAELHAVCKVITASHAGNHESEEIPKVHVTHRVVCQSLNHLSSILAAAARRVR